jgi:septal ring factor EnvC (AmiA/AmiB activator)
MKYRKNPGPADRADDVGVDVMGADLPQAFADEVAHPKAGIRRARAEQRSQQKNTNTSWILPFGIMMVLVLMASYFLVSQHEESLVKHLNRDKLLREQEMSHEFNIKYSELQEENSKLKGEIQQLLELQQQNEKLEEERRLGQTEQQVREKKIDHLTAYKKKMQENIQLMSKTALLEKQVSERYEYGVCSLDFSDLLTF